MQRRLARAMGEGRDAAIATHMNDVDDCDNPYFPSTKSHLYWQWGYEQALTLIGKLKAIGR